MKRLVLALIAMAAPGIAHAACTSDLPGRGVLNVYADPTSDGVIGGIGANQCGLEVSDFCANGRCLAFFSGLSGYIDVTGLASGTITPFPSAFEYEVSGVDGSLSFMGRTQPFEMNGNEPVRITAAADHVVLSLPDPLPKDIRMRRTGSSSWEANLQDWVGVPIPVTIYLDQLSGPKALLELFAENQMLRMDMRLRLSRIGAVPDTTASAPIPAPVSGEIYACDKAYDLAVAVGKIGEQTQIDRFYAAVAAAGITDWDSRTEPQCSDLLIELDRAGIPKPAQTNTPDQNCDALAAELRPILRGPASAEKSAVMATMVSLGITSIDTTNPKHCAEISAALGR